ncbi:MAG TPA: peptidyl-prolyl cis-trans isomerase [Rhodothermales bacterium]|nr:peptidyl-prolyl cis-trans isomerase [Rhodothermales bacterium]
MSTRLLSLLLVSGALALGAAGVRAQTPLPNPTLAVVRGERIDGEAFRARYIDHVLRSGQADDVRLRQAILSSLVAERLLAQEARELGLEETPAFRREEAVTRRRLLIGLFVERVAFAPITVTEAEREEAFRRSRTTVSARHLYAHSLEDARRLKARLDAGETFEALAREVFADTALANHGGLLEPFSFDEMDPAFEDAAFTLPIGQVSEPVQTEQGYSILRVERRFERPLATETEYATKRDRLDAYVQMRKRQAVRADLLRAREAALGITFDRSGVEALLGEVRGGIVVVPGDDEIRREAPARQQLWQRPVATFTLNGRRTTWTVADVARQAIYASEQTRARVRTPEDLETIVRALAVQEGLVQDARARGLERDEDFSRTLRQQLDRYLVTERARALRQVQVPEDSLRAFFARFGSDMTYPPTADVSEILVDDAALARRLRAQLDGGADLEMLARMHTVRPGGRETGGRLGWATQEALGALGSAVFEAAPGSLLGPIPTGGKFAVLRVNARAPSRPLSYEEARPRLQALVSARMGEQALDAHLRALRDAGGLTFDLPALAALPLYAGTRSVTPSSGSR